MIFVIALIIMIAAQAVAAHWMAIDHFPGLIGYLGSGYALSGSLWLLVHEAEVRDPLFARIIVEPGVLGSARRYVSRDAAGWDFLGSVLSHRRVPITWVITPIVWTAMAFAAPILFPEIGLVALYLIARCIRPSAWWLGAMRPRPTKEELRESRLAASEAEYRRAMEEEYD